MAETKLLPIGKICANTGQIPGVKANPRCIKNEKYDKLKKSLQDNPEMLELRELLVYEHEGKYVCIGGNMRYRACKELGYKEVPCKVIPPTATPEQLNAYIIKDNAGFGEWDWDMLANEWDSDLLDDWGVDVWQEEEELEEPTNLEGGNEDKPFAIKITFENEKSLKEFRELFESQITDKYKVNISVSGGKL